MRVTYRTINRGVQQTLLDRYSDLNKLQQQLATGKRLLRPSDEPIDVANDLKLRSKVKQLEQYQKNINDGMGFMEVTDSAIESMDSVIQRLRELAIAAASDTLSATERTAIARETEQLTRQTIALINTSYKGDYVFAGTQTKIMPYPLGTSSATTIDDYSFQRMAYYDASAVAVNTPVQLRDAFSDTAITNIIPGTFSLSVNGTKYREDIDFSVDYSNGLITILPPGSGTLLADVLNGSIAGIQNYSQQGFKISFEYINKGKDIYGEIIDTSGKIEREIESGITSPINICGNTLLYDSTTNINLLNVMVTLGADLLHNNRNGINTAIGNIDIALKTILASQTTNGARINRFETTMERNESQQTETTRLQSDLEDAD
ncbi:MAG: flagellar hook-associated protein FlgL, partial [Chitinivibrionales bacterium]|nr:flagellar hook-associated protein FlgL [Chitinivibrionales bacterium]